MHTTSSRPQGPAGDGSSYARFLGGLESAKPLGPLVTWAEPLASRLTDNPRLRSFFRGDATGIPLHGILTDAPFGAWWAAIFLDSFPDDSARTAAKRLVAAGVVMAVPTAISGWAQWSLKDQGTKRVGVVHALINAIATLVYVASWAARECGQHGAGIGLARAGALLLLASGFLGGHLRSGRPRRITQPNRRETPAQTPTES